MHLFQSSLPHGSDPWLDSDTLTDPWDFNPRSLTGATLGSGQITNALAHFNPRSLTGATHTAGILTKSWLNFNPRSLTGATEIRDLHGSEFLFQSSLPHGSDRFD